LGLFRSVSDPCSRGVKIAKIAIATERGARSLRPFGDPFWYVFTMFSQPPYPTAFRSVTVADPDVFWGHLCSCASYVVPSCPARYSHVSGVNWSGITPPACYLCCRGLSCTSPSDRDPELLLECLNRFTRVRASLGIVFPLPPDGFRVFLRVWGKYQLLY